MSEAKNKWSSKIRMRERMEKVRSKRFVVRKAPTSLPTVIQSTESTVQPTEASAVELATIVREDSAVDDSIDESLEDESYAFTSEEAQLILREWSADQLAEAFHREGILAIEILMWETGMSRSRAAEAAANYTPSSERILLNDEKVLFKANVWLRAETA